MEKTLILLKPDCLRKSLAGEVIKRFEGAGYRLLAMKMLTPSEDLAGTHYADLGERISPVVQENMIRFLISGPIVAMVWGGGTGMIGEIREKLIGATEPKSAAAGTIRGDLCDDSYEAADKENRAIENLTHASDSVENAEKEIAIWFKPEEIIS